MSAEPTPEPTAAPERSEPIEPTPVEAPDDHPSREAARYRTRLREVEGERDALRLAVDELQREAVERAAGDAPHYLHSPADVWLVTDLGALRGDDGRLDGNRVRETLSGIVRDRPEWSRRPDMGTGTRGTVTTAREMSFGELVKRRGEAERRR